MRHMWCNQTEQCRAFIGPGGSLVGLYARPACALSGVDTMGLVCCKPEECCIHPREMWLGNHSKEEKIKPSTHRILV